MDSVPGRGPHPKEAKDCGLQPVTTERSLLRAAHPSRARARVPAALLTSSLELPRALGLRPGPLPSPGLAVPARRTAGEQGKGPHKLAFLQGSGYPVERAEQSEERSLPDFLPPPPRLSRQEKFSRQGQACPPRPENARVPRLRGRACGAGSEERAEEGTGPGGAVPHNLAPGHPGPPPQHRPRVPAGAPSCRGYCGGPAGVHPVRRGAAIQDFPQGVRPIPGLSRPPPPLPSPSRARAARGGRRGRAAPGGGKQSEEERTVLGEEPAPAAAVEHPLLPAPRTRRWRRQPRKEEPVPQRHSALQYRPPRAGGDGGGGAAADGSIGARSPGAGQPAGPAPYRRAGMRGRAPWRPITVRRPPGPPSACLTGP